MLVTFLFFVITLDTNFDISHGDLGCNAYVSQLESIAKNDAFHWPCQGQSYLARFHDGCRTLFFRSRPYLGTTKATMGNIDILTQAMYRVVMERGRPMNKNMEFINTKLALVSDKSCNDDKLNYV